MAAINLHYPKMKVFQLTSTQVASGAKIYTYEAGISTDKATYSDQALTTANANPVITDSNGEAQVWLEDDGLYKIVIHDSDDVLISSVDNVGTVVASTTVEGAANLVPNGSFESNTGDNGSPTGWDLSITGASTIQIDQTDPFHGDSCLEFVGGASGAGTATSGYFEVQSSKQISIRFSLKASAATVTQTVKFLWYTDDAGTAASTASTTIYNVTTTAPTAWAEQTFVSTPGSDVLFAKVEISGSTSAGTTRYDDIAVGYNYGTHVFADNSNGNPNISDTLTTFTSYITENAWESIGPTGGGATNTWTALDSINDTNVDWIEVRCIGLGYTTAGTVNASQNVQAYARKDGGAQSPASDNQIGTASAYLSGNGYGAASFITTSKIPVSSLEFEMQWSTTFATNTTMTLVLLGYGYNTK